MKYCYILLTCFSIALFVGQNANGQKTDSLVTIEVNHVPLQQFLTAVESQVNYHFYYDNAEFDSTLVTVSAKQQPLVVVLKSAFDSTDFKFSIDAKNRVFISRGRLVKTSLPNYL